MSPPKILIQLDPDAHANAFDAVVAIDAGVDHLLQYAGVTPEHVVKLVHGAIFTRGPAELANTAVFVGGSSLADAEEIYRRAAGAFFGPLRVSVLLDPNGANSTAAAAVLSASRHVALQGATAVVLAATGPVGQRAARLLSGAGARVRVCSRVLARSEAVCRQLRESHGCERLEAVETGAKAELAAALVGADIVIASGAAGVQLLPTATRAAAGELKVAIDLNAVPPVGIEGIDSRDRAVDRGGVACYGALGVGGLKMKIHREAVKQLFTRNDLLLDAENLFEIGRQFV